jgi:hypothetical protein
MQSLARPYRSHKVPACDRCRKRKAGCKIDLPGQKCQLCSERNWDCTFAGDRDLTSTESILTHPGRPSKRRRSSWHLSAGEDQEPSGLDQRHAAAAAASSNRLRHRRSSRLHDDSSVGHAEREANESSIIIGPAFSNDVRVLDQHLRAEDGLVESNPTISPPYNCLDPNDLDPVLYLSVPKRRKGLRISEKPGEKQKEILDQILRPYTSELISLLVAHR